MNLTTDQLSYILERKYPRIRVGTDVIISCSSCIENEKIRPTATATIDEWNIPHISQPTVEELQEVWDNIKDQYHSDPTRDDSLMFHFLETKYKSRISINNNI